MTIHATTKKRTPAGEMMRWARRGFPLLLVGLILLSPAFRAARAGSTDSRADSPPLLAPFELGDSPPLFLKKARESPGVTTIHFPGPAPETALTDGEEVASLPDVIQVLFQDRTYVLDYEFIDNRLVRLTLSGTSYPDSTTDTGLETERSRVEGYLRDRRGPPDVEETPSPGTIPRGSVGWLATWEGPPRVRLGIVFYGEVDSVDEGGRVTARSPQRYLVLETSLPGTGPSAPRRYR